MNLLVPQGIGDSIWALLKVQSIAGTGPINIFVACMDKNNYAEARALEFISRFSFVNSAQMYEMPMNGQGGCVLLDGPIADEDGLYRYISDGETTLPGIDYVLMPNAALERGTRLEDWLPQYGVNWRAMDEFRFDENILSGKDYAIFFLGSMESNTRAGHNRNGIWRPEDWVALGEWVKRELGCGVVVVGANYDHSYFLQCVKPLVGGWVDLIGDTEIGQTYSIIKGARFVISYQSGIGIVANYMGVPAGIFWRAKGDSISPDCYISFDERMASAWADPQMIEQGKHMPLIYGRHGVDYIIDEIKRRGW